MATAAIATNSLNKVFIISKYQLVKEIRYVVVNYPSHYRCKVFVSHNISVSLFEFALISFSKYRARSFLRVT